MVIGNNGIQTADPKTEMMMSNDKPTEIISWDENGRIVSELSIRNGKRTRHYFWIGMMMVRRNLSWFIKTTSW